MWKEMAQVAGNSKLVIDYDKIHKMDSESMTSKNLCINTPKENDFAELHCDNSLKKANRQIMK